MEQNLPTKTSCEKPIKLPTLIDPVNKMTFTEANNSIQLSKLKKDQGEAAQLGYIMLILSQMLPFVKFDAEKWTAPLLSQYAKMIAANWYMFKAQELTLCITKGINGTYGKVYGNIAYTDLARWMQCYSEEKESFCDNNRGIEPNFELITHENMLNAYKEIYAEGQAKLLAKTSTEIGYESMDKVIPTLNRDELLQLQKDIEAHNMNSVYKGQLSLIESCLQKTETDEQH